MEAQREHGAITDEKARNVVALYAALIAKLKPPAMLGRME
jgi:hypothetical protein